MIKTYLRRLLCLFLPLALAGCATATRGGAERVQINSLPPGATAISDIPSKRRLTYQDGSQHDYQGCAPTPCSINFSRRANPVVEISKAGYAPIKFKIVSTWETGAGSVRPGAVVAGTQNGSHVIAGKPDALRRIPVQGASLIGGVFTLGAGSAIDLISGSNFSLSPNPVTAKLAPLAGETAAHTQNAPLSKKTKQ